MAANTGPTLVTPGHLQLRATGLPAVLTSAPVPALAAGEIAELILETPVGTQPEGQRFYEVRADTGDAAIDGSPDDNHSTFLVRLWADTDSDGLPDGWETEHGLSSLSDDADDDADNDGSSNLLEYMMGTSPRDAASSPSHGMTAVLSEDGTKFVFDYMDNARSPYLAVVQASDDLVSDEWQTAVGTTQVVSTDGTVEHRRLVVPREAKGQQFFRVRFSGE